MLMWVRAGCVAAVGLVLSMPVTADPASASALTASASYGPQTTLSRVELLGPCAATLDTAGDVFVADCGHRRVVELPRTSNGYGAQLELPFQGLLEPGTSEGWGAVTW
jgi:hypothetical protein